MSIDITIIQQLQRDLDQMALDATDSECRIPVIESPEHYPLSSFETLVETDGPQPRAYTAESTAVSAESPVPLTLSTTGGEAERELEVAGITLNQASLEGLDALGLDPSTAIEYHGWHSVESSVQGTTLATMPIPLLIFVEIPMAGTPASITPGDPESASKVPSGVEDTLSSSERQLDGQSTARPNTGVGSASAVPTSYSVYHTGLDSWDAHIHQEVARRLGNAESGRQLGPLARTLHGLASNRAMAVRQRDDENFDALTGGPFIQRWWVFGASAALKTFAARGVEAEWSETALTAPTIWGKVLTVPPHHIPFDDDDNPPPPGVENAADASVRSVAPAASTDGGSHYHGQ